MNIWEINRQKINHAETECVIEKIKEKAQGITKHLLNDLCSETHNNGSDEAVMILILGYFILYYLSEWQGKYHNQKINFDANTPTNHPFDKQNFNKLWKFDVDTQDIIDFWISTGDKCKLEQHDNNIRCGMIGNYGDLEFECEYGSKFESERYKDLTNALEYDEDGEIDNMAEKTQIINGIGNDIEEMLLLPDFIDVDRWYFIDLTSSRICDCTTERHSYRICIGQIKDEIDGDGVSGYTEGINKKFVVWKNKYLRRVYKIYPDWCDCGQSLYSWNVWP